jgi:hypothetical protein
MLNGEKFPACPWRSSDGNHHIGMGFSASAMIGLIVKSVKSVENVQDFTLSSRKFARHSRKSLIQLITIFNCGTDDLARFLWEIADTLRNPGRELDIQY